jgi:quaternary ammonium compound-resistance protein SugE
MFALLVCLAALSFSAGGYFMKLSDGLRHVPASAAVFALFAAGAALQTLAMRGTPMTNTYVIVLGLEALVTYAIGAALLGEPQTLVRALGVVLTVAGIALLRGGR